MIKFTPNGLLFPDQEITLDLNTFKTVFVDQIPDEHRLGIFENFIEFCKAILFQMGLPEIQMILNGSFTSLKRNPNDLDIVVLLNWEDFQKIEPLLEEQFHRKTLIKNRLDIFFLIIYPESHPNHRLTDLDYLYWVNLFSRTRPNRKGIFFKKGYLNIKVQTHEV